MSPRLIIEADGGSRGNPGPAGCGAVVRDADSGEVLAERSIPLGTTTNNVAEYEGLIAGLEVAAELGASEVEARLDSKLVVEQMCGRWRVKHANLRPLADKAKHLAGSFPVLRFEWIPRARNAHADRLANHAMDEQAGIGGQAAGADTPASAGTSSSADTAASAGTSRPSPSRPGWTGATGAPTKLMLLRHGQTEMSVDRRYSGRGDVPLTDLGLHQASSAGERLASMRGLPGAPVVTSPLLRARQTADAVVEATSGELTEHDGLLETDFGAWEGLTFLEAAEQYAELHRSWLSDPTVEPPHGESLEAVFGRVRALRDELVDRFAGQTVVLVSHVTPIKSMLRLGLDVGPSLFYRLHLDLASLSIVEFYPDGNSSVRLVNDVAHLQ